MNGGQKRRPKENKMHRIDALSLAALIHFSVGVVRYFRGYEMTCFLTRHRIFQIQKATERRPFRCRYFIQEDIRMGHPDDFLNPGTDCDCCEI